MQLFRKKGKIIGKMWFFGMQLFRKKSKVGGKKVVSAIVAWQVGRPGLSIQIHGGWKSAFIKENRLG